jgi:hypothetical protein
VDLTLQKYLIDRLKRLTRQISDTVRNVAPLPLTYEGGFGPLFLYLLSGIEYYGQQPGHILLLSKTQIIDFKKKEKLQNAV